MALNPAGQIAAQAIINLANAINPQMDDNQKLWVSTYANQIVEQLVQSADTSKIGQAANFTKPTDPNTQDDTETV